MFDDANTKGTEPYMVGNGQCSSNIHRHRKKSCRVFWYVNVPEHNVDEIKEPHSIPQILLRTKKTLSAYEIGIAIFDNSQMFTKLKYQRNGKSSSSTIVTSQCFVKPWIPLDVDALIYHATAIEMTYNNQAIPSPPLAFE